MKKQITLAIALFASATAGLAQSSSATIIISGSVAAQAAITATAAPALTDTELNSGVVDKQMSVVNERSNRHVGYGVALKSANAAAASSSQARLNAISAGNKNSLQNTISSSDRTSTRDNASHANVTTAAVSTPIARVNTNLTLTRG